MSEYQYYEFQAIDCPLSEADRQALRNLSTRARITATSLTNSYEWGDFKGKPAELMQRWFDLHLYLANWGSRRLMIRLPERLVDRSVLGEVDCADLRVSGDNLILDIARDELEFEDWDDGTGWLAALAPLRADVLAGDLRLFYLLWLTAVEADVFAADEPEPMPGIGPLSGALEAFAEFFGMDLDLVQAAAERSDVARDGATSPDAVEAAISAMSDSDKTAMLSRLTRGDPHVAAELRAKVRNRMATGAGAPRAPARTVGHLRARADAMRLAREQAAADRNARGRRRRPRKPARPGCGRLRDEAKASGARWRLKSNGATPRPTTRRRPYLTIFAPSPGNGARWATSFAGSEPSASGTPGRSGSSNGSRHWDSAVGGGVRWQARVDDDQHCVYAIAWRPTPAIAFCTEG